MNAKHLIVQIAALLAAPALAAPALADSPQLRNDRAHFGASDGYPVTNLGAPDGWVPQFADGGPGAALHPDNRARYVAPEQARSGASEIGSGFDWRAGLIGVLAFVVALASLGMLAVRTRTRMLRA